MTKPDKFQLSAADPTISAWVEASAGSGKTSVLSDRVLRLLLCGVEPEKILCLTFTNNAAAEMANRLTDRLSVFASQNDDDLLTTLSDLTGQTADKKLIAKARRLFAELLDAKGGVKIMTLHAFAQSVLKRFPVEAGISPHFNIADDTQSSLLIQQAQQEVLNDTSFYEELKIITQLVGIDRFSLLTTAMAQQLPLFEKLRKAYPLRDALKKAYENLFSLPEGISKESLIAQICHVPNTDDLLFASKKMLQNVKFVSDVKKGQILDDFLKTPVEERPSFFKEYLSVFLKKTSDDILKSLVTKTLQDELSDILYAEAERLLTLKFQLNAEHVMTASLSLAIVGQAVAERYAEIKHEKALMDYNDMILTASRLMADSSSWVMYKLDGGIDHILLDEAQDTSPQQWQIVKQLIDEFFNGQSAGNQQRTFFVVGDKKQSIYSFQGADPDVFEKMHRYFETKSFQAGIPFKNIPLNKSFRSVHAVIDLVNAVLRTNQGAKGVLNTDEDGTHFVFREKDIGLTEIWNLEEPLPKDTEETWTKPVERIIKDTPVTRLVQRIAKRIARMLNDKEMLVSKNRPIQPSDILILLKKRHPFMEPLIRELKALNIPVGGIDRLKLTEHLAVKDLMVLGEFLLFPEDDLSLATVLRSPLCGLSEEELFTLCSERKNKSLWHFMGEKENDDDNIGKAYRFLKDVLNLTDTSSPYDLYAYVLQTRNKMKAFGERLGIQSYDALEEFLSLALQDETQEIPSLQRFLNRLKSSPVVIKRDAESSENVVRLMTVHGAKGLQAPIVFLPDTRQIRYNTPTCFWPCDSNGIFLPVWIPSKSAPFALTSAEKNKAEIDEMKESNRLLYVALTRAADRLYIGGINSSVEAQPFNWYDTVRNAVSENHFVSSDNMKTESQPVFSQIQTPFVADLPFWINEKAPEESVPPKPLSPSKIKEEEEIAYPSPLSENREKALRKGILVHKLLELGVVTSADIFKKTAEKFMAVHASDFTENEQQSVICSLYRILTDTQYASLFAKNALSEVCVAGIVENKAFCGKIDRLAVTQNDVYIADYKSNQRVPKTTNDIPKAYILQMQAYYRLIERIYPDKKIHCLLIWTEDASVMKIPDTLLN